MAETKVKSPKREYGAWGTRRQVDVKNGGKGKSERDPSRWTAGSG
jgi:hypothetical protein